MILFLYLQPRHIAGKPADDISMKLTSEFFKKMVCCFIIISIIIIAVVIIIAIVTFTVIVICFNFYPYSIIYFLSLVYI